MVTISFLFPPRKLHEPVTEKMFQISIQIVSQVLHLIFIRRCEAHFPSFYPTQYLCDGISVDII